MDISIEDKAAVFDVLVSKFQGTARLIHTKRATKEIKNYPHESTVICKDIPVYEFRFRVAGHDDFTAALLALIQKEPK